MPAEIVVPRLGWGMDEGVFRGWLKADGDAVAPGEPLFAIESDKALQDIESMDGGVLRIASDAPPNGATVAVGRVIGYLLRAGESMPSTGGLRTPPIVAPAPDGAAASSAPPRSGARTARVTPRARRLARVLGVDAATLRGTGRNGRVRERDVRAALDSARGAGDAGPPVITALPSRTGPA